MSGKTIQEIRSRNFLHLFEQFKKEVRMDWPGEPDRGMLQRFAKRLGISPIAASQYNNGKVIGTAVADKFEKALGLNDLSLHEQHDLIGHLAGFGHVGWDGHPFAAERQLVDSYIVAGRLKRFAGKLPASFSQGVR